MLTKPNSTLIKGIFYHRAKPIRVWRVPAQVTSRSTQKEEISSDEIHLTNLLKIQVMVTERVKFHLEII